MIAISGKKYVGKTTASNIFCSDFEFERVSLADPLKKDYAKLYQVPLIDLSTPGVKEIYRESLIAYADSERAKDNDVYVKKFVQSLYLRDRVVCDDVRDEHELQAMELLGAIPVRIKASLEVRIALGHTPNESVDRHNTESGLDHLPDSYFTDHGGTVIENFGPGFYSSFMDDILAAGEWFTGKV